MKGPIRRMMTEAKWRAGLLEATPENWQTDAVSPPPAWFRNGAGEEDEQEEVGEEDRMLLESDRWVKLLRNRREAQVRQMRRDIAALLRDKQEDTARIRVEHVIREQNFMAANEIIELFCELIVMRLPIIAKQKFVLRNPWLQKLQMEWSFKLYASVKNEIIVMPFMFIYDDILILHILLMYTTHVTGEGFSSIQLILTVRCFYTSPFSDHEYDNGDTMQLKDAASAARAAAESAERAASAANAPADFANKNNHPFDEVEDCKDSAHEYTHPRKRQSMSNSSRPSRKEDTDAFDELKPHGGKASSTGSFSGTNHVEDTVNYPADLDTRKTRRRNSRAARKVHSEIKFDDSEGLYSESEDENDVEIQSVERPLPPTREPFSENRHSEEEGPDNDFPELPKANHQSRVHPNMPLDYETLTARFEALKIGKLP
nr:uncharacterized protein LOC117844365 [Setaria viridis]